MVPMQLAKLRKWQMLNAYIYIYMYITNIGEEVAEERTVSESLASALRGGTCRGRPAGGCRSVWVYQKMFTFRYQCLCSR